MGVPALGRTVTPNLGWGVSLKNTPRERDSSGLDKVLPMCYTYYVKRNNERKSMNKECVFQQACQYQGIKKCPKKCKQLIKKGR